MVIPLIRGAAMAGRRIAQHRVAQGIVRHPVTQAVGSGISKAGKAGWAGAGMMAGLAIGGAKKGAETVNRASQADLKTIGNFFALFALILWIIDALPLPILGDVYQGFNFDPRDFWENWFSKFTFGNVWFDALIVLVSFFIIIKYAREQRAPNGIDILSIFLFSLTIIFFIANPGWAAFPKAILHFIFIILFGFMYLGRLTNMNFAFLSICGLLFFDFFLFSTALNAVPVLKYISLLSTIVILMTFGFTPSGWTATSTAFLIVFIIVMSVAEGFLTQGVAFEEGGDERPTLSQLWDKFRVGIGTYQGQIQKTLDARIQYAITGKVEENEFEPLGVYLENVQSADPRYYEDEEVVVWGTVTARTLDDPIFLKIGCFVQPDIDKYHADIVDPKTKFPVFTLEENDFACTFGSCKDEDLGDDLLCKKFCNPQGDFGCKSIVDRGILETGRNTITTFADFNFETLAFLKVYFMNRERQRAMVRQGLDPFEEFAIEDKNPIAVYTNGPAKIEMGTNNPLISVSKDYIVEPSLDIKIDNREEWQGEIKRLKEFVLFLPDGVDFKPQQSCGSMKFLDYKLGVCGESYPGEGDPTLTNNCCTREEMDNNKCMACTQSCQDFVVKECKDVCSGFENTDEIDRCNSDCDDRGDVCKQSCASFFAEGAQLYNGYALDTKDIKYRNEEEDFEKGKLFRCRFRPTESVLGASPFTTKSFRIKARYDYSLEEDVSVEIVELPDESVGPPRELRVQDSTVKNVREEGGKAVGDIILEWSRSVDDGSGANDVTKYKVYRTDKLEDEQDKTDWDNIKDIDAGTNTFTEEEETWYRYTDNVEFPADFKYYYHVEARDEDGNWAKSLQMLEITPGSPEDPPETYYVKSRGLDEKTTG